MTEASLAATSFAPLDLLLANLTISDQRIHTRLRQPLPCAVHAKAESLGLNSILATKSLVIVGASLLYPFAIGMLRSSPLGSFSRSPRTRDWSALGHCLGRIVDATCEGPRIARMHSLGVCGGAPKLIFFTKGFDLGFGLLLCLVDLLADLRNIIARWLDVDDEALPICCTNNPPTRKGRIREGKQKN